MSTTSDGGNRPPQLDDRDFVLRHSKVGSQQELADMLNVSRKTVRLAYRHHEIPASRAGRKRGSGSAPKLALADELIPHLIQVEKTLDLAPTLEFLLERVGAVMRAHYAGETRAEVDALLSVASIAGIRHDHLQAVRAA